MPLIRFAVHRVSDVPGRGRMVTGKVLEGTIRAGMWAAREEAAQDRWRITGVEFAPSPSRYESYIALVLEGAPPLEPGTTLLITA